MKIKDMSQPQPDFQPVLLEILIETPADMKVLWAMANAPNDQILQNGRKINLTRDETNASGLALFRFIDEAARNRGLLDKDPLK